MRLCVVLWWTCRGFRRCASFSFHLRVSDNLCSVSIRKKKEVFSLLRSQRTRTRGVVGIGASTLAGFVGYHHFWLFWFYFCITALIFGDPLEDSRRAKQSKSQFFSLSPGSCIFPLALLSGSFSMIVVVVSVWHRIVCKLLFCSPSFSCFVYLNASAATINLRTRLSTWFIK